MEQYRKKPIVIEAVQYTQEEQDLFENAKYLRTINPHLVYIGNVKCDFYYNWHTKKLSIQTLEGEISVSVNDWIIKGVNGEYHPCKPDIFEKTYELVTHP